MVRRSEPTSAPFLVASIASLIALLVYGFVDAELYATSMSALLFIPLGFALALSHPRGKPELHLKRGAQKWRTRGVLQGLGALPVLLMILLSIWPGALERIFLNAAVLSQTRAELHQYQWPIWPMQDQLRREDGVDLSHATAFYHSVLTLNPQNPTAHRRLGQIALSRGDYGRAMEHLHRADSVEPRRDATQRLLGEVHAVTGNVAQAVQLWQSIDLEYAQVEDRLWWYGYLDAGPEKQSLQRVLVQIGFGDSS